MAFFVEVLLDGGVLLALTRLGPLCGRVHLLEFEPRNTTTRRLWSAQTRARRVGGRQLGVGLGLRIYSVGGGAAGEVPAVTPCRHWGPPWS